MITNITNIFDNTSLNHIDPRILSAGKFEGWYGSVYKIGYYGKSYALKVFKPIMRKEVLNKKLAGYDYEVLKTLNGSEHYPKIHAYKEHEWMIVDWVDGIPFRDTPARESYLSQLHRAYTDAINAGWFPDDVKGDNLVCCDGTLMIIDVGSYMPVVSNVEYNIYDRVMFVINHAHIYPSVRDEPPYDLSTIKR